MIGHRGLLVVMGVLSAGGAQAQQGVFMRDALSNIGLIEPEKPAITYRERAPLVMPPKLDGRALPPPRQPEASAQWPKDPEVVQRQREREEARKPIARGAQGRVDDNNMTLSIDEMRGDAGPAPRPAPRTGGPRARTTTATRSGRTPSACAPPR